MRIGDIVFLPAERGYVKYTIKKILGSELIVSSYRTKQLNFVPMDELLSLDEFVRVYNNEEIFE